MQLQLDEPLPTLAELQQPPTHLRLLPARRITMTADIRGTLCATTEALYFQPDTDQVDADAADDEWGAGGKKKRNNNNNNNNNNNRKGNSDSKQGGEGSKSSGSSSSSSSSGRSSSSSRRASAALVRRGRGPNTVGAVVSELLKERSGFVAQREKWRHRASRRWPLASVQRVLMRRFRQQDCALEFFTRDSTGAAGRGGDDDAHATATTAHFFTFDTQADRDAALEVLARCCPAAVLVHSPALARHTPGLLDRSVTQRWLDRKLSNFDYLMLLNQASGRSNNDLSQ